METTSLLPPRYDPELVDVPGVTLALGGNHAALALPGRPKRMVPAKPRGPIRTFSKAARRRLLVQLASLNREAIRELPLFVTLTYPKVYPKTRNALKRDLDTFIKRLLRRFPHAAIIWKLEYQKRGAPHYHLLIFNVRFIPHVEVARAWYEVVGSGDKKHLAAGTEVKRTYSWRQVTYYVSKYLGKVIEDTPEMAPGRFWGCYGRRFLPTHVLVCYMAWRTAYRLRRVLWARAAKQGYATGRRGRWDGASAFIAPARVTELLLLLSGP